MKINRKSTLNIHINRIFKYSGIVGPILYFLVLIILGKLWIGYDPIRNHMSELGGVESPYKDIMNIFGFMLLGVFILLFSIGYFQQLKKSWFRLLSFACLMTAGIFMIIVGFFPCDPKCIDITTTGRLHSLTSIPQSIALPLAAIFSSLAFAHDPHWGRWLPAASLILGLLSMITGPIMMLPYSTPLTGLIQRAGMGLSLLWMMIVSIVFLKKNNK